MGSTAFPLPRGWPEVVFAVGVAVASILIELMTAYLTGVPLETRNFALLLVGAVGLLAVRRLPILAAVVLALVPPAYYVLGDVDSGAGWLAFAIGVVWLAMERERVAAVTAALLSLVLFITAELSGQVPLRAVGVFVGIATVLAVGEIARSRRAYLLEVKQRLAHAERTREEEARRRSTEERMRIARELHDVLAHQISLINVQAGAAAHRRDPEGAYAALEEIRLASKGTLRELRTILGVLRQVDEDDAELLPTPGVDRLDELTENTRRAGLDVQLVVEGTTRPLPTAVDAAAYRVVQESLTNAVRHAEAGRVEVRLTYSPDQLTLYVQDDGRGFTENVPRGNGLLGITERVAAVGGTATLRNRPEGGAYVEATLPIPPDAPTTSEVGS